MCYLNFCPCFSAFQFSYPKTFFNRLNQCISNFIRCEGPVRIHRQILQLPNTHGISHWFQSHFGLVCISFFHFFLTAHYFPSGLWNWKVLSALFSCYFTGSGKGFPSEPQVVLIHTSVWVKFCEHTALKWKLGVSMQAHVEFFAINTVFNLPFCWVV